MSMTVFWLVFVAVMLLIEIPTMGLTTIWFCLGSAAAAIVSAVQGPLWLQIVIFTVVSIATMLFIRPWAMKHFNQNRVKTNVDEPIGKEVVVIEAIDNLAGKGQVMVNGVEWMARREDDTPIAKDAVVVVQRVSGVKLFVKPFNK